MYPLEVFRPLQIAHWFLWVFDFLCSSRWAGSGKLLTTKKKDMHKIGSCEHNVYKYILRSAIVAMPTFHILVNIPGIFIQGGGREPTTFGVISRQLPENRPFLLLCFILTREGHSLTHMLSLSFFPNNTAGANENC